MILSLSQHDNKTNANDHAPDKNNATTSAAAQSQSTNSNKPAATTTTSNTSAASASSQRELAFFGVYDGHSGGEASLFMEREFPHRIARLADPLNPAQVRSAVMQADADFMSNDAIKTHGTTACFAVVEALPQHNYNLTVGHVGDSRALLIDQQGKIRFVTQDHKPDDAVEQKRIKSAGGMVQFNRVDGELAMSRSIGDHHYKTNTALGPTQQKVSCEPDVVQLQAKKGEKLILCCDGLLEKLSNEQVVSFVEQQMQQQRESYRQRASGLGSAALNASSFVGIDPAQCMSALCQHSLLRGSKDNMSCMLILFGADPQTLRTHLSTQACSTVLSGSSSSSSGNGKFQSSDDARDQPAASNANGTAASSSTSANRRTSVDSAESDIWSHDEFIAGAFASGEDDKKFVEAYVADARKCGVEGARLMALARQADTSQNQRHMAKGSQSSIIQLGF